MEWEWQDAGAPSKMPYPVDWKSIVKSMRDVGMTVVVIQDLEYKQVNNEDATRLYKVSETIPNQPRSDDTTDKILAAADGDMTVFLGLVDAEGWGRDIFDGPADQLENYLLDEKKGLAAKNIAAADRIWALYRGHESFKAWYVPLEIWNFNLPANDAATRTKKIDLVRRFWRKITDHLTLLDQRDHKTRSVAIAPYFVKDQAMPGATEDLYADLLAGSGINILMLQDGRGARPEVDWQTMRSYYQAFANACKKDKVAFWADIEIYESTSRPTDLGRLEKQLALASDYTDTAVVWDFYEYMNPVVDDCCFDEEGFQIKCTDPDRGLICVSKNNKPIINAFASDRRALYEAYKKVISTNPRSLRNQRR